MGKSSKPTLGYWHKMTLYQGHMVGEADALHRIESGGEAAWEGTHTGSGDIVIDQPELFGGETGEGGIRGTLSVRMGESTQMPHPLLVALRPGPWPAARGLVTTVFDGDVGAMTKRVNPWTFVWSRYVKGWDQDNVWQPALAQIGDGMNPAHIIYDALTDTRVGYGELAANILDEDNLLALAELMVDEQFGLCLGWRRGVGIGEWLSQICEHIGASWGTDHLDRIIITPYRGDYDVAELPLLDESNIIAVEEYSEPQIDGGVNEVTVIGKNPDTGKEIVRTYSNLAAIQAQGRVVAEKRQLPGLWNEDLVARVAARECNAVTSYPARAKLTVKASAGPFVRGEVRAFSWGKVGVARMAVRIEDIDEGDATDTRVHMTVLQDVAGMAQTAYLGDTPSGWTPPDRTPRPLDPEHVYEATYRDLAGFLRPADLERLPAEAGYLVALGARPPGPAYHFALFTRTASAPFEEVGSGDFSPTGVLPVALAPDATSVVLASHRGLGMVRVGEECIIGGVEHCRVTSIDAGTGTVGIARGCVDTVPQAHLAGAVAWFPDVYNGHDEAEYIDGETVDAQLRTRTSTGTLPAAEAVTRSVQMDGRAHRPYPPGRVRINGQAWPPALSGTLTATWAHRDRILQADQVVDTEQTSIGPEEGMTYNARWYLDDVLVLDDGGLAGPSSTFTPAGAGTVRVEIESERGGAVSWQRQVREFGYTL